MPSPARSTRRDVLQGLSAILGSAAVSQVAGARDALDVALAYEAATRPAGQDGQVLRGAQLAILRHVCALTIPPTDTPGAAELDVHGFIDNQLFHCHDASEQALARAILDALDSAARDRYDTGFAAVNAERQLECLTDVERARNGFDDGDRQAFKFLKNLLVFGYLTTETGGTKILAHDPFPGGFKGSIPYASVGRSWLGNV